LKFHEYAEVFPLIDGAEFDSLVDDIKSYGLREPIVRYKGKILDGRNRFLASQKAKIKPKYRDFKGDDAAALAFVVSANVQRRHLNASQLAMAAARISTMRNGDNQHSEGLPIGRGSALVGASERNTARARKVIDEGSKPLQRAVEAGDVSVSRAAAVVDLPKSEQLAAATAKPSNPTVDDERWVPDDDEAEKLARAEQEYDASIDKVMKADDKLAAAQSEIKRQAAEIASLKVSRDGYLNGKDAVTKLLKKEQRRAEQLSRALDKAKADLEKMRERIAIMEEAA
jgi:hypothetical protein